MTCDVILVTLRRCRRYPATREWGRTAARTQLATPNCAVNATLGPMNEISFSAGTAGDVAFLALGMAILATLLWMAYRTLQHPRLPVIRSMDDPPAVTPVGVLRYVLTTPIMVTFWMSVLLFLLSTAAKERTGEQIVVATTAVIGGARLLAHVHEEIAHELAKAVPIAILGFILIGSGFSGWEGFVAAFDDMPADLMDEYWFGLVVFDMVITAMWFGWLRLRWRRREVRVVGGGSRTSAPERAWRRLRNVGYSTAAGEE